MEREKVGLKARARKDGRAARREHGAQARKDERNKLMMERRRIPLTEMQGEDEKRTLKSEGVCL